MNKRLLLVLGAVILVVSLAIWLLHEKPSPPSTTQATPAATPRTNVVDKTVTQRSVMPPEPPSEPSPLGYKGLSDPRWKEREEKLRVDDVYEWKMPINFYGRVIDENELPIAGAKADFQWSDTSESGASSAETLSDATGRFELTGRKGNGLTVRIGKAGYYTPRSLDGARFENTRFWDVHYYEPDPDNPVLFHLRKKGEGEPLGIGEIAINIPANGTPVRFDLLNKGRVSPDGQLEIAAVTNSERYPPRIFDWRATIAVPDGGLVEYSAEFPFAAPEAGYQRSVEFNMPASAPDWKRGIDKSYFIQFGTPPKYGRIQVHLNGDSQRVSIGYWVNPSGSRNLEPGVTAQTSAR